ncbi:MAG TPA: molecular chaperone TorD family protein [Albitalea sp.]
MNQPLHFTPAADDREELQRAEIYGLLARLFYGPPSRELHEQLAVAPTVAPSPGGALEASWGEVVAVVRRVDAARIAEEYESLFWGIGKPEVFLYGSHHIAGALNEKPLVALRDTLARLGLARAESMSETEDHIAYLCEVMRFLIAGDDVAVCNLGTQQRFFDEHLRGWTDRLFEQLAAHPGADFYRAVAQFAREFFAVEAQAFDMLD